MEKQVKQSCEYVKPTGECKGIYFGSRGEDFKTLITSVLKKGSIKQKYISLLTSEENLFLFGSAFTSEQVDEVNSYQTYEQLGDLTANKFIVNYIYRRFPQLNCAEGVKVVARLRINYGSKNSFSSIAEKLGFWDFISATNDTRFRKRESLLEDVLEAFLGVVETVLDNIRIGVGYACCYRILAGIFDEIKISLLYEDLYDAKTRLKELFDLHGAKLGPLVYEDKKVEESTVSTVYRLDGATYETRPDGTINMNRLVGRYTKVVLGQGVHALKAEAQQIGAKRALETLAKQGYVKYVPAIYEKFSHGDVAVEKTEKEDVVRMMRNCTTEDCKGGKDHVNHQFYTRGKSKYQSKYTSTILGHYCRKRDYLGIKICLEMGAKVDIPDSEGMYPVDLLVIGKVEEKLVKKVLKKMRETVDLTTVDLKMNKSVWERYFSLYDYGTEFVSGVECDENKELVVLNFSS